MKNKKKKDGYHSLRAHRDKEVFKGSSQALGQYLNFLFPPNLSVEIETLIGMDCVATSV